MNRLTTILLMMLTVGNVMAQSYSKETADKFATKQDTNAPLTQLINSNGFGLTNLNATNLTGILPLSNLNPAVVTNGSDGITLNGNPPPAGCVNTGETAWVEGQFNTVGGKYSHAEGEGNAAYGFASHAQGESCEAGPGENNFAGGSQVHVTGSESFGYGYNLYLGADGSFFFNGDYTWRTNNTANSFEVYCTGGINLWGGVISGNGLDVTNIPYANITGTPTLGYLAASNSITSNNISGSVNYRQVAGVPAFLTSVTSNNISGHINYGQLDGTPSLGTAAYSNATAFVLNSAVGISAAGGITNPPSGTAGQILTAISSSTYAWSNAPSSGQPASSILTNLSNGNSSVLTNAGVLAASFSTGIYVTNNSASISTNFYQTNWTYTTVQTMQLTLRTWLNVTNYNGSVGDNTLYGHLAWTDENGIVSSFDSSGIHDIGRESFSPFVFMVKSNTTITSYQQVNFNDAHKSLTYNCGAILTSP